ncbi:MAG TPA: NAD(P)-binding domain-containing protein [Parafilimonas sp.]|nr:NAD(P)-binding domain-containing protein [Parafilimonas sp.]
MKVGIIGSGAVGKTLANAFKNEGYEVMLGTRDPSNEAIVKFNTETKIDVGTFNEVGAFGALLVLCVKGSAAEKALQLTGEENINGKIIIDTTNPIDNRPPVNGVLYYFTDANNSLMEKLQNTFKKARFVKCFSSVGNALMYKPKLASTPTMFICGNDEAAKETVTDILTAFGWEAADMGKAEAARAIEPLCVLWCIDGFLKNDWSHAFKLLKA